MIKEELLDLLNNLENIDGESIEKLEELKRNHPYFQAIPILQAKIASDKQDPNKGQYISKAAIYTADRKNLKDLIEGHKSINKIKVAPSDNEIQAETISQSKPVTAPSETAPPQTQAPEEEKSLKEIVEEEKAKVFEESSSSTSNELYDEVMKNLNTLKSLREQYDFLEEQEEKEKAEKEEKPKKTTSRKGRPPRKTTEKKNKTTGKKKSSTAKKTTAKKSEKSTQKKSDKSESSKENISENESSGNNKLEVGESVRKIDLNEQNSIIDSFIKNEPEIARKKPDEAVENKNDLSEKSTKIHDELVSENLADIMLSQGKTDKAVEIYKKLIWKFPQKKAYFASRIEELTKK